MELDDTRGITIRDILILLDERNKTNLGRQILEDYSRNKNMIIMVNGKNIKLLKELETEVKDGDVISIFPPAGGG